MENITDTEPLSIMQNIERIVSITKNCKFKKKALQKCKPYTESLEQVLQLTEMELIFLAAFIDNCYYNRISYSNLGNHFGTSSTMILCYIPILNSLTEKSYIRCRKSKGEVSYYIPQEIVRVLAENQIYTPPPTNGLDIFTLFARLNDYFEQCTDNVLTEYELRDKIQQLLDDNSELSFVKKAKKALTCDSFSLIILVYFCHLLINQDDDSICFSDIEEIIKSKHIFTNIKRQMKEDTHPLQLKHLIEKKSDERLSSKDIYTLTRKAKEEFLNEFSIDLDDPVHHKSIIPAESIVTKELFYNEAEGAQLTQLYDTLAEENFQNIQQRLSQQGMRKGFAILFYGSPGTGKTESVYQIARATGRDIFEVNVSQIKSKWVGESEQNMKATFENYRKAVATSPRCPILLFNEADSVLGLRREGATDAVDKMENSIQNIILQEMEILDGIMIATTNLTNNLDKAFERRFLYKVEFNKPSLDAKLSIWRTMLPSLTKQDALTLAKCYDFSGGQIENISRKVTVETIIHGKTPTFGAINTYCRGENIENNTVQKPIGFL